MKKTKMASEYDAEKWEACKRKHKMNEDDIRMARELGFSAQKLLNLPARPAERWKMPPAKWVRHLYRKKQKKAARQKRPCAGILIMLLLSCLIIHPIHTAATAGLLNYSQIEMVSGQMLQLKAAAGLGSSLTWSSSDNSIVSVDTSGLVTCLNTGNVTVTARDRNGNTASCMIRCRFSDVPASSAEKSYFAPVYWAADKGITVGSLFGGRRVFRPDAVVTRAQMITFLWRMAGKPRTELPQKSPFTDVSAKSSAYRAIVWGYQQGIIKGYSGSRNGYFGPDDPILRRQVAVMLWRWQGRPESNLKKEAFADVTSTDSCYRAVIWGSSAGIIKGSKGQFLPADGCKRSQVVTFLYRYARDILGKKVRTESTYVLETMEQMPSIYISEKTTEDTGTSRSDRKADSTQLPAENQDFSHDAAQVPEKETPCEHEWIFDSLSGEITCTFGGNVFYKCSKCGKSRRQEGTAPGHDWAVLHESYDTETSITEQWIVCKSCLLKFGRITRFIDGRTADGSQTIDEHCNAHYHNDGPEYDMGYQTWEAVVGTETIHHPAEEKCQRCGLTRTTENYSSYN